jgi:hypothetical protein
MNDRACAPTDCRAALGWPRPATSVTTSRPAPPASTATTARSRRVGGATEAPAGGGWKLRINTTSVAIAALLMPPEPSKIGSTFAGVRVLGFTIMPGNRCDVFTSRRFAGSSFSCLCSNSSIPFVPAAIAQSPAYGYAPVPRP